MCDAAFIRSTVRAWAETIDEPIRVYFFGSRFKGTHRPDSDIDIAVEPLREFLNYTEWFCYWLDTGNKERWRRELEERLEGWVELHPFNVEHTSEYMPKNLAAGSEVIFSAK